MIRKNRLLLEIEKYGKTIQKNWMEIYQNYEILSLDYIRMATRDRINECHCQAD